MEVLLATAETPSTSAYALYIVRTPQSPALFSRFSKAEHSALYTLCSLQLDVGQRGDLLDLLLAVASCLMGYAEVGMKLAEGTKRGEVKMEGNLYKK